MNRFLSVLRVSFALIVLVIAGCATSNKSITTPSGLTYTVLEEGSGPVARAGQYVLIHETTMFSEGVTGMRVGERRKLIVPPKLSRRSSYSEGLSPEDTLHYEVELVGIEP